MLQCYESEWIIRIGSTKCIINDISHRSDYDTDFGSAGFNQTRGPVPQPMRGPLQTRGAHSSGTIWQKLSLYGLD